MADINPKPEEVAGKVTEMREEFAKKYSDKFSKYDQRDIDRFNSDDAFARCFLRTLKSRGDISKALEVVHDSFKYRKEICLNDLTAESFPEEITGRKGIYYQGVDKQGHPILYIKTKENTANGHEQTAWLKKYIAWNFEQHHSKNPEQMCVVILDMSGAGIGNVNMDITKFILACFTTYFPAYLAYMLNYEMPGLLSATWKVISAFLSKDQNKKSLRINKKDISKYIDEEHLWPHMK